VIREMSAVTQNWQTLRFRFQSCFWMWCHYFFPWIYG